MENMKIRTFLLTLIWMLAMTLQAQTYTQLWKNVEQMGQQDLPKSVIAEAGKIYIKAKTERNVPQMMKAYLTMMAWRGNISSDSVEVDIKGLEEWASSAQTDVQDKAVLNSILGGIYLSKDFDKGNRYLNLSLEDSLKLVDYPADKLVPMVKSGETSLLYFDNNLYDLLARRAIRLWTENQWNASQEAALQSIRRTYRSLLHLYKEKGIQLLLDAYKELRPSYNLPILNIIGSGPDYDTINQWIKENNMQDLVFLRGAIYDMDEKAKYFSQALACISPKQAGLTVLESMGYGVPFISTKKAITGGELFNIHNGVDGVLMDFEDELISVLKDITLYPNKYISMGEKAKMFYNQKRTPLHMAQGLWSAVQFAIKDSNIK